MRGNVAHDDNLQSVVQEFLDHLARNARRKVKEVRIETLGRNYHDIGLMLGHSSDHVHRLAITSQGRTFSRQFGDPNAVQVIKCGACICTIIGGIR